VTAPAPIATPPVKKPVAKPAPVSVTPVPVIVAMQSSSAPGAQQTFIAVQNGTATQTVPTAASVGVTAADTPLPAQSNVIQQILSDPKALANDFYIFVMVLFFIALTLNIFVNIRVQYPRLIAGGLLVIVVAGLCVVLNQNIGFLHVIVL